MCLSGICDLPKKQCTTHRDALYAIIIIEHASYTIMRCLRYRPLILIWKSDAKTTWHDRDHVEKYTRQRISLKNASV